MSSPAPDDPAPNPDGITPAPVVMFRIVFNMSWFASVAFLRTANPSFRPLHNMVQTRTERSGHGLISGSNWSRHSSVIRTGPARISWMRWKVGVGSSRRRVGRVLWRSGWTQNQTWPRRCPKMVPITIILEDRSGATERVAAATVVELPSPSPPTKFSWGFRSGSSTSRSEVVWRFLRMGQVVVPGRRNRKKASRVRMHNQTWRRRWVVEPSPSGFFRSGSSMSSRMEVVGRFLVVDLAAEEVLKQGRRNRVWMQNQKWPRLWLKMVRIILVSDGATDWVESAF
ncbi:unnamed protein product [Camellia sinensis]